MPDPFDVEELAHKLVTTFHLSVPERAVFMGNPVPGSLLRSAILSILQERGSFPPEWRRDTDFDGGLIEVCPDGSFSVTWKAEVGLMRYKVTDAQTFSSATKAVDSYAERFFGWKIDGTPVDWRV